MINFLQPQLIGSFVSYLKHMVQMNLICEISYRKLRLLALFICKQIDLFGNEDKLHETNWAKKLFTHQSIYVNLRDLRL